MLRAGTQGARRVFARGIFPHTEAEQPYTRKGIATCTLHTPYTSKVIAIATITETEHAAYRWRSHLPYMSEGGRTEWANLKRLGPPHSCTVDVNACRVLGFCNMAITITLLV